MGGILGNVPGIDVGRDIDADWSSTARWVFHYYLLIKYIENVDVLYSTKSKITLWRNLEVNRKNIFNNNDNNNKTDFFLHKECTRLENIVNAVFKGISTKGIWSCYQTKNK